MYTAKTLINNKTLKPEQAHLRHSYRSALLHRHWLTVLAAAHCAVARPVFSTPPPAHPPALPPPAPTCGSCFCAASRTAIGRPCPSIGSGPPPPGFPGSPRWRCCARGRSPRGCAGAAVAAAREGYQGG
eukprot:1182567-Prorocentrum_minimum.AAC.1